MFIVKNVLGVSCFCINGVNTVYTYKKRKKGNMRREIDKVKKRLKFCVKQREVLSHSVARLGVAIIRTSATPKFIHIWAREASQLRHIKAALSRGNTHTASDRNKTMNNS